MLDSRYHSNHCLHHAYLPLQIHNLSVIHKYKDAVLLFLLSECVMSGKECTFKCKMLGYDKPLVIHAVL